MVFLDKTINEGNSIDILARIKISTGLEKIERDILMELLYYGIHVAPSVKLLADRIKAPIDILRLYLHRLEQRNLIYKVTKDRQALFTTYKVNVHRLTSNRSF